MSARYSSFPAGSLLLKHRKFIEKIYRSGLSKNENKLKAIINQATADEVLALCELSRNILRDTVPNLDRRKIRKLRQFKTLLRKLSCRNTPINAKKELLRQKFKQQRGGAIPFLVSLLAPLVGSLISAAVT